MRTTKFSWTFPLLFIIVFLGIYLALRYYKEGLTTASLKDSRVVNSINYTLGGQPYTMNASRVWSDPHGNDVWVWKEEASTDPNLVKLNAISPNHPGQTLTLDLDNNQYIWTEVPGKDPIVGVITSTS